MTAVPTIRTRPRSTVSVCVFCGASQGNTLEYRRAAHEIGRALGDLDARLVFGAGAVGMMGAVSRGVLERHGDVVGVIPEALLAVEQPPEHLSALHVVTTMHERKALMHQLSDVFVALPGGLGTFEELFEVLTMVQLGMMTKPVIVGNIGGYFDGFVRLLDEAVATGFLAAPVRDAIEVVDGVDQLVARLTEITAQATAPLAAVG